MNKNLERIIQKCIQEVLNEQPAPAVEPPPTKPAPSAPPKPNKPSRPNPLTPTRPGIAPKPKALSSDVELFLKSRKGVSEAIDIGDYPDYFDPSKKELFDEKDYVEQILPDLGPAADRYLEMITSESYKKNVDRICHYLNIDKNQLKSRFRNVPTMLATAMSTLSDIQRIERSQRKNLEKMAVDLVLEIPENKLIAKLVKDGQLKIEAKLGPADLSQAIAADELDNLTSNGLTVGEELNQQMTNILSGNVDNKLRRMLANYITQGDAVNKLFLYNLVNDKLDAISPDLSKKYGILAAITQLAYYGTPHMEITRDLADMASVGSEQVVPDGEVYKIQAKAVTFPYLIHELVKGINDYLSMDLASQEELDTETLGDEIKQIMAGPALELKLRSFIPSNKIELLPIVKKLFYRLPPASIKDVLLGGMKAGSIMKDVVNQAEQSWKDYEGGEEELDERRLNELNNLAKTLKEKQKKLNS